VQAVKKRGASLSKLAAERATRAGPCWRLVSRCKETDGTELHRRRAHKSSLACSVTEGMSTSVLRAWLTNARPRGLAAAAGGGARQAESPGGTAGSRAAAAGSAPAQAARTPPGKSAGAKAMSGRAAIGASAPAVRAGGRGSARAASVSVASTRWALAPRSKSTSPRTASPVALAVTSPAGSKIATPPRLGASVCSFPPLGSVALPLGLGVRCTAAGAPE
jgi:hypothetical protein